jgi:multidrug efflux pump subunit AcrB
VLEATVAQPIEAKIVGVDKMIYMRSSSGSDGSYNLTVSFLLGTDPDLNTVNVNNRVQTALANLPPEVQAQGLTVQKRSSSMLQFVMLYSEDATFDSLFISNYGVINVDLGALGHRAIRRDHDADGGRSARRLLRQRRQGDNAS